MSDLDRITKALRSLIREMFPRLDFMGVYEYRVASQDGDKFDLQIARKESGMPDLFRVPMRTGFAGAKAELTPGTSVLVSFVDGDPSRPFVAWADQHNGEGFKPIASSIEADTILTIQGGILGAARQTDAVVAGPFAGTITGPCSLKTLIG